MATIPTDPFKVARQKADKKVMAEKLLQNVQDACYEHFRKVLQAAVDKGQLDPEIMTDLKSVLYSSFETIKCMQSVLDS